MTENARRTPSTTKFAKIVQEDDLTVSGEVGQPCGPGEGIARSGMLVAPSCFGSSSVCVAVASDLITLLCSSVRAWDINFCERG
jgi:hypothetical protein